MLYLSVKSIVSNVKLFKINRGMCVMSCLKGSYNHLFSCSLLFCLLCFVNLPKGMKNFF